MADDPEFILSLVLFCILFVLFWLLILIASWFKNLLIRILITIACLGCVAGIVIVFGSGVTWNDSSKWHDESCGRYIHTTDGRYIEDC